MSLGRLLAAGKSLVGLRDTASRYRMNRQVSLPKFISPKNPFASPGGEPAEASPATPRLSPAEIAAANLKETQRLPAAATARSAAKATPVFQRAAQMRANAGDWARKLNPLQFRAHNQPVPKPGPARSSAMPVQGELSLDKVKVVRNDLSEADLEIVVVKPGTESGSAEPVLSAVASHAASASAWSRFATRIFRAGTT